jgi:hypothetical protein
MHAFKIYADTGGLFVGTWRQGQVWNYKPSTKEWKNLNVIEVPPRVIFNVYGMARLEGKLVVSMGGYDTTDNRSIMAPVLMQNDTGGWTDITPSADTSLYTPFQFSEAIEWNGSLIAITGGLGVWRLKSANWEWERLPNPKRSFDGENSEKNGSIALHQGHVYVGSSAGEGIHRLAEDFSGWTQVDSSILYSPLGIGGNWFMQTPLNNYGLASSGKHRLATGVTPAIPLVYMGDYGAPFGNEAKGWRSIQSGWCDGSSCPKESYGVNVIGDTLYAVAWEGVYKFPLAELDSVIAGEASYPTSPND